jgi:hypothetical protein
MLATLQEKPLENKSAPGAPKATCNVVTSACVTTLQETPLENKRVTYVTPVTPTTQESGVKFGGEERMSHCTKKSMQGLSIN